MRGDFLRDRGWEVFALPRGTAKRALLRTVEEETRVTLRFETTFCFMLRSEAGECARQRSHLLLLRQKNLAQEKAAPLAVSLRFATGNLRCLYGRLPCVKC